MIVVLRTPSVAERLAKVKFATEAAERSWTAQAFAAQQQVLTQLARHGLTVRPLYSYARVIDGFSASLDPRAVALLNHLPEVAGVYPVRVAYPASLAATAFTGGRTGTVDVGLAGFDGNGISIALLDTGVERLQPYIRGRVSQGFDVVGGSPTAAAQRDPQDRRQIERHGTELAGVLAGSNGPDGIHGVAPAATVLPIRIAGWQPGADGRDAIYGRSDQLIAGLERAVDPNGDGDTHDAVRVALIGLAEPFAAFPASPEAQAVEGARELDVLVVAPVGNDGDAGPLFGSVGGPAGSPAALSVGATDTRPASAAVRVVFTHGLSVLGDDELTLLNAAPAARSLDLALVASGRNSSVKGKAELLRPGANPLTTVNHAVDEGAAAVVFYGRELPSGSLGDPGIPVVELPEPSAEKLLAAIEGGASIEVAIGHAAERLNPGQGRVTTFSSRGLTFGGALAPQLSAAGVDVATSDPGSVDGEPAFATVTGTSVAAATVAGAAALVAQARPGLSAADLASLLAGSSRRSAAGALATGAGTLDAGASAVGELAASQTTLSFGPWKSPRWRQRERILVRNVSHRRLRVTLTSSSQLLSVEPATVTIGAGQDAKVVITASAGRRPALDLVTGTVTARPAGSQALRIPWVVTFRLPAGSLLGASAIAPQAFAPSDSKPAVLSVVVGRVPGRGTVSIEPAARLELLLYSSGGAFLGVLGEQVDLLPGAYSFGITGRAPSGSPLAPGAYQVRIVAWPELGGVPSRTRVEFRIE
jgi:Subtilase family/Peptidase inhibitor I9